MRSRLGFSTSNNKIDKNRIMYSGVMTWPSECLTVNFHDDLWTIWIFVAEAVYANLQVSHCTKLV